MGKKNLELKCLSDESTEFFNILNKESDLSVALIGASFIDHSLAALLKNYFRKSRVTDELLDSTKGALGTLFSKVQLAYCLELIDKNIYQNIKKIAEIRNKFAHHHLSLNFEDKEINDLCNKLNYLETKFPNSKKQPKLLKDISKSTNRNIFSFTVALLSQKLLLNGLSLENNNN